MLHDTIELMGSTSYVQYPAYEVVRIFVQYLITEFRGQFILAMFKGFCIGKLNEILRV